MSGPEDVGLQPFHERQRLENSRNTGSSPSNSRRFDSNSSTRRIAATTSAEQFGNQFDHEAVPLQRIEREDLQRDGLRLRSRENTWNTADRASPEHQHRSAATGRIVDVTVSARASPFRDIGLEGFEEDSGSISVRSQFTYIQRKDLGMLDVAALIVNKQIGTGIFTTPGLVLGLTGSKTVSIIMWFCGGIWAFLSVIIYVEFGSAFPFNGGEMIYLDEVFRRPELLATMLFSTFFVLVPNTDGNSLQFAKHVLLAAVPSATVTEDLDKRLISFVGICVLTLVCMIHYFSRNSGLLLNLLFAAFKIVLVIVFIIRGAMISKEPGNGRSDWGEQPVESKNVLAAMIFIIYSYQGWENANYVGGEVKVESRALKWGAFLAVGIVTCLYTLVNLVYSLAVPFHELADKDLGIVGSFAPKAFGKSNVDAIKICIAMSAFGNLIAVVYTSAKVKQQIARQCVIPFYKFFGKDDEQFKTPGGALILHWIFAVIWILCTPNTAQGYGFVIGLFIYGQLIVGVFVGFAFFFIKQSYETDVKRNDFNDDGVTEWHPIVLKNPLLRITCGLIFVGMNLMVVAEGARSGGDPPSWLRPVLILGLMLITSICWAVLRLIAWKSTSKSPVEIRIIRDGIESISESDQKLLGQAKMEMNSRVVVYELNAFVLHEHLDFVHVRHIMDKQAGSFLKPIKPDYTAQLAVVDYALLRDRDSATIDALFKACANWGFFYLDLSQLEGGEYLNNVELLFEISKEYFAKPQSEKSLDTLKDRSIFNICGYKPAGLDTGNVDQKKDGCEGLRIPTGVLFGNSCDPRLSFPLGVQQHEITFKKFSTLSFEASSTILKSLSGKLGLDGQNKLEEYHRRDLPSTTTTVLQFYPLDPPKDTSVGHSSHTDTGSVTILFNTNWGLQVYSESSKEWLYVPPRARCAIVNIGDALRFLSGFSLKSSLHRVVPCPQHWRSGPRYATIFFLRPNDEARFVDSEGTQWRAQDWLNRKFGNYRTSHSVQRLTAISTGKIGFVGLWEQSNDGTEVE